MGTSAHWNSGGGIASGRGAAALSAEVPQSGTKAECRARRNEALCRSSALSSLPKGGFTLAELLVVMAIIALLAALLIPAIRAARWHAREGATKMEIRTLETAMTAYFTDWGVYPPDRALVGAGVYWTRSQCLVYYLGTAFRVSDGFSQNGGPYFDFPADRLVELGLPYAPGRVFVDMLGQDGRVVYCYRFDNNDADGGDQTNWGEGYPLVGGNPDPYNSNFSNVHPQGVDIWSAGRDGVDRVSAVNPTQSNITSANLGDDIGNW